MLAYNYSIHGASGLGVACFQTHMFTKRHHLREVTMARRSWVSPPSDAQHCRISPHFGSHIWETLSIMLMWDHLGSWLTSWFIMYDLLPWNADHSDQFFKGVDHDWSLIDVIVLHRFHQLIRSPDHQKNSIFSAIFTNLSEHSDITRSHKWSLYITNHHFRGLEHSRYH